MVSKKWCVLDFLGALAPQVALWVSEMPSGVQFVPKIPEKPPKSEENHGVLAQNKNYVALKTDGRLHEVYRPGSKRVVPIFDQHSMLFA